MLDHGNAQDMAITDPEKNNLRESLHQRATNVSMNDHPPCGHRRYAQNLSLKFVQKIIP